MRKALVEHMEYLASGGTELDLALNESKEFLAARNLVLEADDFGAYMVGLCEAAEGMELTEAELIEFFNLADKLVGLAGTVGHMAGRTVRAGTDVVSGVKDAYKGTKGLLKGAKEMGRASASDLRNKASKFGSDAYASAAKGYAVGNEPKQKGTSAPEHDFEITDSGYDDAVDPRTAAKMTAAGEAASPAGRRSLLGLVKNYFGQEFGPGKEYKNAMVASKEATKNYKVPEESEDRKSRHSLRYELDQAQKLPAPKTTSILRQR